MTQNKNSRRRISYTALGMSIGLILGGIVGFVIDNMVIFAGGGMVLELAIAWKSESIQKRTVQYEYMDKHFFQYALRSDNPWNAHSNSDDGIAWRGE